MARPRRMGRGRRGNDRLVALHVNRTTDALTPGRPAFNAQNGKTRWTIGWSVVGPSGSKAPSAPVVTDDVVFGVGPNSFGGTSIFGDNAKTGARLWDSPVTADYGDPIVANGVVYAVSTDGTLHAFHLPGH